MTDSLWFSLQKRLRDELPPDEFRTWFSPLRVGGEDSSRLVLVAPSNRFVNALEEGYRPMVNRAMAGLRGPDYEVLFSVEEQLRRTQLEPGLDKGNSQRTLRTAPASKSAEVADSNARDTVSSNAEETVGSKAEDAVGSRPFNARYRFESFVVGSSNQFAHAAARAVAESPGHSYNPLFLYGGVGLGKTHLLHAAAHEVLSRNPNSKILYLTAEQFVNELINSIRFDRMPAFRERYRTIDVLLVDDIQFLANKERTQEEFFHTFNALYSAQKQIILSSDSSPRNIPTLEERLRSRFEWGLIADIQSPDLETRIAILRRKAELERTPLEDEVALFIAQQVKSNIRELEGLLNRVIAFSSLTGRPLDIDLARETLKDILPDSSQRPCAADIIKTVAQHYGLKVREIKSRTNSRQIAFPRQVAMFLCKRLTDLSYPEIGKQFNDKHHSTVMYSVDKIEQLRQKDADLNRILDRFLDEMG